NRKTAIIYKEYELKDGSFEYSSEGSICEIDNLIKMLDDKMKQNKEIDDIECEEALERNSCYTYFAIKGDFKPEQISDLLQLKPTRQWHIGDFRNNGTQYDFALWEYGRCENYNVYTEEQMLTTINDLIPKADILRKIKQDNDVSFVLEIVPQLYVGETSPCLAPNKEVIKFCYETDTDIDIDLYIFDADGN
ncbi:MAG: hypothetical protein K0R34_1279, partial [Herbinix sp.]|nr:hypothetical protein [Herbinix sp.]